MDFILRTMLGAYGHLHVAARVLSSVSAKSVTFLTFKKPLADELSIPYLYAAKRVRSKQRVKIFV